MSLTAGYLKEAKPQTSNRQGGFTLLELAVAITIVGLLSGGVLLCLNAWSEYRLREENLVYMQEVKKSLLAYAKVNGRLPTADTDQNGTPDAIDKGYLPYAVLGVRPKDAWGRQLRYHASQYMSGTDAYNRCQALTKSSLTPSFPSNPNNAYNIEAYDWYVKVWDSVPVERLCFVPAIIVSGGARDADKDGVIYDKVSNRSNNPATNSNIFVRFPPNPPIGSPPSKFDDMVVYLEPSILYAALATHPVSSCGGPATPAP